MAESEGNSTWPPTVAIAPPSGQPADQIGWRPMIVNWFGSMFFIGLCSPLLVWLVVYYIRTRDSRKGDRSRKSIASFKRQVRSEIQPYHGWIAPHTELDQPKHQKMKKRDHFARYLGWWSTSVAEPARAHNLNRGGPDQEEEIHPGYPPEHHPWILASKPPESISLESLAERGENRPTLSVIQEVATPTTSGSDIKSKGQVAEQEKGKQDEQLYLMSGALGSDDTENNTIRKRAVGGAQAKHWADLNHELRRAATTRLLFCDEGRENEETPSTVPQSPDLDFRDHEDDTTLAVTPPSKASNDPSQKLSTPKLRKVCSSPTLHIAFKQLEASNGPSISVKSPETKPHQASAPLLLYHCRDQIDGSAADLDPLRETTNVYRVSKHVAKAFSPHVLRPSKGTPAATSKIAASTSLRQTQRSKLPSTPRSKKHVKREHPDQPHHLHRSFSWDASRRSTLDVPGLTKDKSKREATGPEYQTVDTNDGMIDYEREDSLLDAATGTSAISASNSTSTSVSLRDSVLPPRLSIVDGTPRQRISAVAVATTTEQHNNGSRGGGDSESELGSLRSSRSSSALFELQVRVYSRRIGSRRGQVGGVVDLDLDLDEGVGAGGRQA